MYNDFRKKRFIEKSEKLSDTIHRKKLKTFYTSHARQGKQRNENSTAKTLKKNIVQAQKMIDLVRVRQYDVKELFKYNLV